MSIEYPQQKSRLVGGHFLFVKAYICLWAVVYPVVFVCEGSPVFRGYLQVFQLIKHGSFIFFAFFVIINIGYFVEKYRYLFVLMALSFVCYLFDVVFTASLSWLELYSVLQIYILLSAAMFIANMDYREKVYKVMFWSLLAIFVVIICVHMIEGRAFYEIFYDSSSVRARLTLGFEHPGRVAMILLSLLVMLLYLFGRKKVLVSLLSFPLMCGMFLSDTRNAMLAIIVAGMLYFCVKRLKLSVPVCVFLAFVVSVGALLVANGYISHLNVNALSSGRLFMWGQILALNLKASVFKVMLGYGGHLNIPTSLSSYGFVNRFVETGILTSDNSYLDLFFRVGLVGLMFIIMILAALIRKSEYINVSVYYRALFVFTVMVCYSFFDSSLLSVGNLLATISCFLVLNYDGLKYDVQSI